MINILYIYNSLNTNKLWEKLNSFSQTCDRKKWTGWMPTQATRLGYLMLLHIKNL